MSDWRGGEVVVAKVWFGAEHFEVDFDLQDGLEVLEMQIRSVIEKFDEDILVLDQSGRLVEELDDLKDATSWQEQDEKVDDEPEMVVQEGECEQIEGHCLVGKVIVRSGALIDSISFYPQSVSTGHEDKALYSAGNLQGGAENEPLMLQRGSAASDAEFVREIREKGGDCLDSVAFGTNLGRSIKIGGSGGSDEVVFTAPMGSQIVGVVLKEGYCPRICKVLVAVLSRDQKQKEFKRIFTQKHREILVADSSLVPAEAARVALQHTTELFSIGAPREAKESTETESEKAVNTQKQTPTNTEAQTHTEDVTEGVLAQEVYLWAIDARMLSLALCESCPASSAFATLKERNRQIEEGKGGKIEEGAVPPTLIQRTYRVADSTIRTCTLCAGAFVDLSMLTCGDPRRLSDLHAPQTGGCSRAVVSDMGLLGTELAPDGGDVGGTWLAPARLFVRRQLLRQALAYQNKDDEDYKDRVHDMFSASTQQARLSSVSIEIAHSPVEREEELKQEEMFRRRVLAAAQTAAVFEDPTQQAAAISAVDFPKVLLYAREHMQSATKQSPKAEDECFLIGLLTWFKRDFFSWCNKPKCTNNSCPAVCTAYDDKGVPAVPMRMEGINGPQTPTHQETSEGWASRVERYQCQHCKTESRFPRYNNPTTLLRTRTGRCGEWANAFTLICRALGADARYVMDFTDHVWTEVWVPSLGRYAHLDSCERALDTPLLYEKGWGKKLTYIISLSRNGVVDSTPRYTCSYSELLLRREEGAAREAEVRKAVKQADAAQMDQYRQRQFLRNSGDATTTGAANGNLRGTTGTGTGTGTDIDTGRVTRGGAWRGGVAQLSFEELEGGASAFENLQILSVEEEETQSAQRRRALDRELERMEFLTGKQRQMHDSQSQEQKEQKMLGGRVSGSVEWRSQRGEMG